MHNKIFIAFAEITLNKYHELQIRFGGSIAEKSRQTHDASGDSVPATRPRGSRQPRGKLIERRMINRWGGLAQIGDEAARLGFRRTVVVTTERFALNVPEAQTILSNLRNHRIVAYPYLVFLGKEKEGTVEEAEKLCRYIKKMGFDSVVCIGGGSIIDIAKVAAGGATNGGVAACKGMAEMRLPALPMIVVPTTAGTGSEATPVAILLEERTKEGKTVKTPYYSLHLLPVLAIIDPKLTVSMSAELTRNTGMDALCHAFESAMSPNAGDLSVTRAVLAMKRIMKYLPVAYKYAKIHGGSSGFIADAKEQEARTEMAIAAHDAGVALTNSGPLYLTWMVKTQKKGKTVPITESVHQGDITNPSNCPVAGASITHMIGLVTGSLFNMEHGKAVGMVLVHSLELMQRHSSKRLTDLAMDLGFPDQQSFIDAIKALVKSLDVPERLPEEARGRLNEIVEAAWANGEHRLSFNIEGRVTREEISKIVEAMMPA